MFRNCCEQWPNKIQNVSKLWTYIKFKSCYGKDPYVCTILSDTEKFNIVMSSVFVKHTAEYLYKAYYKRRSLIYN